MPLLRGTIFLSCLQKEGNKGVHLVKIRGNMVHTCTVGLIAIGCVTNHIETYQLSAALNVSLFTSQDVDVNDCVFKEYTSFTQKWSKDLTKFISGMECIFIMQTMIVPYFTSETKLGKEKHVADDNSLVLLWWVTYRRCSVKVLINVIAGPSAWVCNIIFVVKHVLLFNIHDSCSGPKSSHLC